MFVKRYDVMKKYFYFTIFILSACGGGGGGGGSSSVSSNSGDAGNAIQAQITTNSSATVSAVVVSGNQKVI